MKTRILFYILRSGIPSKDRNRSPSPIILNLSLTLRKPLDRKLLNFEFEIKQKIWDHRGPNWVLLIGQAQWMA